MNTKIIMTTSAIAMGLVGIGLSFMPEEILQRVGVPGGPMTALVGQILGALYFGFAMVNWMSRANLIGGIYARPISIGNLTHYVVAALALLKAYSRSDQTIVLVITGVYVIFAVLFSIIFFRHPVKTEQ